MFCRGKNVTPGTYIFSFMIVLLVGCTSASIPDNYVLEQNYPNPFNPQTNITYSIPEPAFVKPCVYNINGTLVKTLFEGNQSAGRYQTVWDGENSSGMKVGSGVYFYRIQTNSFLQTRKMILLK